MIIMLSLGNGCTTETEKVILGIEGYITLKSDDVHTILVTKAGTTDDAMNVSVSKDTTILNSNGSVMKIEDLKIAQWVEVWVNGNINTSFPSRAFANKIVVYDDSPVEGSNITKTQAVEKALSLTTDIPIQFVSGIEFMKSEGHWKVTIRNNDAKIKKEVIINGRTGEGKLID
ncbi:YobA family protein [Brevibacillus ruminantium]|uniref:YobA family protein n=1 Tax=Brevibacillus ruminantium TaxID=2950604 RepID=A0ABY4WQ92_9BACL|nr:DUF3221 domain-containing protein [Brevibacillus ruminantium]USG66791.1 YobA family protein [Brevibacillus ruminantium]